MVARGQWPMVRTVRVDDPQVRIAPVRRRIGKPAHVNNSLSVGRNLRVGGHLDLELVHGREFVRRVLRLCVRRSHKNNCGGQSAGRSQSTKQARFRYHREPPRGGRVNNVNFLLSRHLCGRGDSFNFQFAVK